MTSDASIADVPNSSVNEFDSGKVDLKKKRKGFFKGLFGRKGKEKENGKAKPQSTKDNTIRKELSYSKSSVSESMTSVSEVSFYNSSKGQAHDTMPLDQKKGRKSESSLSGLNLEDSEERNQRDRLPRNSIINTNVNTSRREKLFDKFDDGEHQVSKMVSQDGSMTMIDVKKLNEFNDTFITQNNVFKESMGPEFSIIGALDGSMAIGVFEDPEPDSDKMKNKIEDMFHDPELDHMGLKMDGEEEYIRDENGCPHNNEVNLAEESIRITQNLTDENRSQNAWKEETKIWERMLLVTRKFREQSNQTQK